MLQELRYWKIYRTTQKLFIKKVESWLPRRKN